MSLPNNFSILSIPAYAVLSLLPHAYALNVASGGDAMKWDNRCPRASDLKSRLRAQLPPDAFTLYERSEAASANCYENQPIFFASIILGHFCVWHTSYLMLGSATRNLHWFVRCCILAAWVCVSSHFGPQLRNWPKPSSSDLLCSHLSTG